MSLDVRPFLLGRLPGRSDFAFAVFLRCLQRTSPRDFGNKFRSRFEAGTVMSCEKTKKNFGCLGCIGDYTIQLYRDYT